MFCAISRVTIGNHLAEEVREAFRSRADLVDGEPGFVSLEVMSPVDDAHEIGRMTHWLDEARHQSLHRGHSDHRSHAGIPRGLKLVPKSTVVRFFESFAN